MRQPIKLIVKKGKLRLDGTRMISLQYCHSATRRAVIGTGIHIPPKFWNKRTGRISPELPKEFGEVEVLENMLGEQLRKADDIVKHAKKMNVGCPISFLKQNFPLSDRWQMTQLKEKKEELDIYHHIDLYVEERRSEVSQCTISVINMMKSHLLAFETHRNKPITFDSFDYDFYNDFMRFLTYDYTLLRNIKQNIKGLRINSSGKTIKWLKIFLTNRMAKKIIPHIDLSSYKVLEEDVDSIYLSWKEISTLYRLDLQHTPILEIVRDEFVLGCLTGFRFSDYIDVKPDEIRDGMLYIMQSKTKDRIVVPLRKETEAILQKYNMEMPFVSNPEFNVHIKEVAKLAGFTEPVKFTYKRGNKLIDEVRPKYGWVMSHTCRRSFCTNEFLDGTPITLIMAISGHRTEKAFRKYIKADNLQKALMVKKLWEGRPGL